MGQISAGLDAGRRSSMEKRVKLLMDMEKSPISEEMRGDLSHHTPMMAQYLRSLASMRVGEASQVFWLTVGGVISDRCGPASA